jgi:hypothetical protein
MFLLNHSEGCNICELVLHECYVNDLYTTTCSGMLDHHIRAILVWRVWVTPTAVPSSGGVARLQGLWRLVLGLDTPALDGLERARLYSVQAF